MEYENKHEGRGLSGTALGLSIGALAASALPGVLGNWFGFAQKPKEERSDNSNTEMLAVMSMLNSIGNTVKSYNCDEHYVSRYELGLQNEIEAKNSKIAHLESTIYTDGKIADVYERLNTKIGILEAQAADQRVYNATLNGTVTCLQSQIAQLAGLTKLVIPGTNICPHVTSTTTTA